MWQKVKIILLSSVFVLCYAVYSKNNTELLNATVGGAYGNDGPLKG